MRFVSYYEPIDVAVVLERFFRFGQSEHSSSANEIKLEITIRMSMGADKQFRPHGFFLKIMRF
jgi:hypothetical protein